MVCTALGMMNKEPKDFDTKPKMSMSIKTWYDTEYPNDENNKYLKDITFKRFVDLIKADPQKSVDTTGMHYGVVRERFIYALMSLLNKTHDEIYDFMYNGKSLEESEIKESKMNKKVAKLTEEKFNALVMEYVLEGHSIQESIVLAEDTITPEMINDLEKTPAYKKLKKDIEYYFKAVDGIEGYRDGDFKDAPIEALQDEADFCKDTANFLGSINFRGFKPEKQKELMQDTAADMEYLDRSALRLTNLLKKQDDSMYLKPDGSVNVNTNQKPGEYARRALRKIRDLFARLGQKWDYDPDFDYKSLPPVDYKMFVADSKNISDIPDWKQGIMNTVNTAVNEGICDKRILLNMANDLDLNEDQKDFYTKYVYYVLD